MPPRALALGRGDALYLMGALAGTTLAVANDRWLTSEAIEVEADRTQRRLAEVVQPLGNVKYVLPATLAVYALARWQRAPRLAQGAVRTGIVVAAAGATALGLKQCLGRSRPFEAPGEPNRFAPFSGHDSSPSGHAMTAFAAAVALDRETQRRWLPYLVYPAAALVGWSRVHDRQHWTSDVVAGAALSGWLAWETEDLLLSRASAAPPSTPRNTWLYLRPAAGTLQLACTRQF